MKRILALGCVLVPGILCAQSFQQHYGGGKYEEGMALVVDDLAITTIVRHYREGYGYGLQLLRTSLTGSFQATIDLPLPGAAFPQNAEIAPDGNIVICGSIIPDGRHDHDAFLMKVDVAGTNIWMWTSMNSAVEEQFLDVDVLPDGYAACGMRRDGADGDALIARFDGNGSLIWQEHFGTELDEKAHGISHDDNGLMAVGEATTYSGDADAYIVRTDMLGAEQWWQTWGGSAHDDARSVVHRTDGSFVWAGSTGNYPEGDTTHLGKRFMHAWIMAMNAAGDTLWTAAPGDTLRHREARNLLETTNGDLLIGGERSLNHRSDAFAIRTDATGAELWERSYALQRKDRLQYLRLSEDGGFFGTGKCMAGQSGQVLLLRKDPDGL